MLSALHCYIYIDSIICRSSSRVEVFEELPLALLPNFTHITGRPIDVFFVLLMQYGRNFSGPGKDVFREARATGHAHEAHRSNFLHPVLYYYKSLPTGRPNRPLHP